jgi:hypothetical protein
MRHLSNLESLPRSGARAHRSLPLDPVTSPSVCDKPPTQLVPTVTFDVLYVFFILSLERRRVIHVNVTEWGRSLRSAAG